MDSWQWRTWEGRPYLTCSLLEPWSHGFFTQHFWPDPPDRLVEALHPQAHVYRVRQVHGNRVLSVADILAHQSQYATEAEEVSSAFPDADGLLSNGGDQAVWVCSADCTPVLMADRRTGQVAAIHAGWRGTAARIVPMAIAQLEAQGSQRQDLQFALGPAIAGEVYQVAIEVAVKVGITVLDPQILTEIDPHQQPETILDLLQQYNDPPILADDTPGRVRLDVRRINQLQLEQLGIHSEQIAIAPHCTYQQEEHFFSYRRDPRKQVQWSGIVSKHTNTAS